MVVSGRPPPAAGRWITRPIAPGVGGRYRVFPGSDKYGDRSKLIANL